MLQNVIDVVWGSEHINSNNLKESTSLIASEVKRTEPLSDTLLVSYNNELVLHERKDTYQNPNSVLAIFHQFNYFMNYFHEEPGH